MFVNSDFYTSALAYTTCAYVVIILRIVDSFLKIRILWFGTSLVLVSDFADPYVIWIGYSCADLFEISYQFGRVKLKLSWRGDVYDSYFSN